MLRRNARNLDKIAPDPARRARPRPSCRSIPPRMKKSRIGRMCQQRDRSSFVQRVTTPSQTRQLGGTLGLPATSRDAVGNRACGMPLRSSLIRNRCVPRGPHGSRGSRSPLLQARQGVGLTPIAQRGQAQKIPLRYHLSTHCPVNSHYMSVSIRS
jgi:hypothetical protein